MTVTGDMTIDPNVTITVAAGTALTFATNASLTIQGTVDIQGTKAQPVNIAPPSGSIDSGFVVPSGGTLKMSYVVQVGGAIVVSGGAFTATDTYMSRASGDFLIATAGMVNVSYSQLGLDTQTGDSTHCDLHFEGSKGTTLSVTHSTISTSSYGLMLYNGTGVDLTFNNWVGNQTDIDFQPGVQGDVSNGWFASGSAPTPTGGALLTADNLSATRLAVGVAGPR
jgi:hypothetical protein